MSVEQFEHDQLVSRYHVRNSSGNTISFPESTFPLTSGRKTRPFPERSFPVPPDNGNAGSGDDIGGNSNSHTHLMRQLLIASIYDLSSTGLKEITF